MAFRRLSQLIVLVLLAIACNPVQEPVDTTAYVLFNASIYTANDSLPAASAMAVGEDGKIVAVGTDDEILQAYPDWNHRDAEGRTVIPGLIDAHAHLMNLGLNQLQVDLVGTRSVDEIIERLEAFEKDQPDGAWLVGRGWDQNDWESKEFPTHHMLDEAFPDRPVWLRRVDGHAAWANQAAMDRYGENLSELQDTEGGKILRDDAGRPTGVFIDDAMFHIDGVQPELTQEELDRALELAIDMCKRLGLTGVHDAGVGLTDLQRYQRFIDEDRFDLRVYGMIDGSGETFDYFLANGPWIDYGNKLTVRSLKLYIDGALGSRGAALLEGYTDEPDNFGLIRMPESDFRGVTRQAMANGMQVNSHAIGDRGNRLVLDVYEEAILATGDSTGRHRVEHAQVVSLDDIPRFKQMNLIASMQPIHATSDMYWAEDRVGPDRILGAYAWNEYLKQGTPVAFGSDFPVELPNPMLGLYAAISRQDLEEWPEGGWYPDQKFSREQALRSFTLEAAYSAFQENELGSLEPGKWADYLILDRDIMTVPEREIADTKVLETYVAGKNVFTAETPSK